MAKNRLTQTNLLRGSTHLELIVCLCIYSTFSPFQHWRTFHHHWQLLTMYQALFTCEILYRVDMLYIRGPPMITWLDKYTIAIPYRAKFSWISLLQIFAEINFTHQEFPLATPSFGGCLHYLCSQSQPRHTQIWSYKTLVNYVCAI